MPVIAAASAALIWYSVVPTYAIVIAPGHADIILIVSELMYPSLPCESFDCTHILFTLVLAFLVLTLISW